MHRDSSFSSAETDRINADRLKEYTRLKTSPVRTWAIPGDRVVFAAGLIGHGFAWSYEEAEVLKVLPSSVKVRFCRVVGGVPCEEWIDPALIIDFLGEATRPEGPAPEPELVADGQGGEQIA